MTTEERARNSPGIDWYQEAIRLERELAEVRRHRDIQAEVCQELIDERNALRAKLEAAHALLQVWLHIENPEDYEDARQKTMQATLDYIVDATRTEKP